MQQSLKVINKKICVPFLSKEHRSYSEYMSYFIRHFYNLLDKDMSILDVGCGRMRHLELFKFLGFENLYGSDKCEFKQIKGINFQQCDFEYEIPFKGIVFDVVICNFVLMFITPERRNYFLEFLSSVVKPGGILIFELYTTARTKNTYQCCLDEALSKYDCFEYLNKRKYGFIGRKYGRA